MRAARALNVYQLEWRTTEVPGGLMNKTRRLALMLGI